MAAVVASVLPQVATCKGLEEVQLWAAVLLVELEWQAVLVEHMAAAVAAGLVALLAAQAQPVS